MILARIETNDEGEEEYVPLDEDDENFVSIGKYVRSNGVKKSNF